MNIRMRQENEPAFNADEQPTGISISPQEYKINALAVDIILAINCKPRWVMWLLRLALGKDTYEDLEYTMAEVLAVVEPETEAWLKGVTGYTEGYREGYNQGSECGLRATSDRGK